jgi:hypothetical protein
MADTIEPVAVGEVAAVDSDERRSLLADQLEQAEQVQTPEPQAEKTAAERARDAAGKFVAKDSAPVSTQKPEGAEAATPSVPPADEPWKKPPQSWKKEAHPHWEKLPPEAAQYVHEREQQMRAGIEQAMPKIRAYDNLTKAISPYMENIKVAANGDVVGAIRGLMEADNILRTAPVEQKRAYMFRLAQMYGVPLGDVSDAPQVSPELYQLNQKIAQLESSIVAERQAKEEAETRSLLNDIQEFATKHDHFETLKPTMIRLLNAGEATDLQTAYTKAIRLNDDLFQAEQAAKLAQAKQGEIKSKDSAAKAARSAAVSVRSATPGANTAPKAQDRRSMLLEQFESVGDRL